MPALRYENTSAETWRSREQQLNVRNGVYVALRHPLRSRLLDAYCVRVLLCIQYTVRYILCHL